MAIDFTQKKTPPKPAGKAKIPTGFASRAKVPDIPTDVKLEAASQKSPLKHPGDETVSPQLAARKTHKKSRNTPKRPPGIIPEIPIELYIRGTARKTVLIEGPEQTIDAFKAFVKNNGVKNWEALQLLIQAEKGSNK